MNKTSVRNKANCDWQTHLSAVGAEQQEGWEQQNQPGSFGCHELLDRVSLIGDLVESQVLQHPACALKEEWYLLANQATEALRELYQRIGSEHVTQE